MRRHFSSLGESEGASPGAVWRQNILGSVLPGGEGSSFEEERPLGGGNLVLSSKCEKAA